MRLRSTATLIALVFSILALGSVYVPSAEGHGKCQLSPGVKHKGSVITGTAGNDIIDCGSNGFAHTINALGGDDQIATASGNDIINGGDGDDFIFGGPGNDIINGGTGNDSVVGDQGADTCDGGPDFDTIVTAACETSTNFEAFVP